MSFVDGYVIAVPTARKNDYIQLATKAAQVFRDHGAIGVVECWAEDVPEGKVTSFPMAVKRQDDEAVVFSWVEWPSREVRDVGMKKVFEDPRMQDGMKDMPFDGKRMIFGGFGVIVENR